MYAVIKGASLTRLVDVEATTDNTLLILTYRVGKKIKTKIVKVEDVDEIGGR